MAGLGAFDQAYSRGVSAGQQIDDWQKQQLQQQEEERLRQIEASRNQFHANQQQGQQQGAGLNPMMMSSFAKEGGLFGGSGASTAPAAGGSGLPAAGGAGASAGGSAGGSAAGAGGSSAAGSLSALGPWAALAAVIAVNEKSARNGGHRNDGFQYVKDLVGGKVLEQDANSRWQQKLGGYNDDKTGLLNDAGAGAEFTTLDFSNGFKKLKNGTTGKIIDAVKKIF